MTRFTEEQKKIALLLLHEPKTAEDLNKQLNIPYNKLMQELKGMLKLNVVAKDGYPTKYVLKPNIAGEVRRRKRLAEEDLNKLRLKAYIEMQAIEKELLEKQINVLKKELEKDENFTIYGLETAEIEKQDEYFSTYLELNFTVRNFVSLVRFVFFYGPSSVEVIKQTRIEFSVQDFQDGLMDMINMVNKYSAYITKILNKDELERFHKQIFEH